MSEEKKIYCSIPEVEICKCINECEETNCLDKQLQACKEENEKLKTTIGFITKTLEVKNAVLDAYNSEIDYLTQQNKQMKQIIELGLSWVHNHKQCSLDNKCGYEARELQNLEDILAQQNKQLEEALEKISKLKIGNIWTPATIEMKRIAQQALKGGE